MATDWIKMRVNLPDDPRVRFIAKQIKCHVVSAIGCLYMLWSLADQQTTDGTLWTYTASDLDRRVGREGFAKACAHKDVDWLLIEEDRLVIKRFEDHNGASAKARAQTAKRVRKHREEVTGVTPQPLPEKKRRDKNKENPSDSLPDAASGDNGSDGKPIGPGESRTTEDAIYRAYPRHVEPQAAKAAIRKAISAIKKRGTPNAPDWLLERVKLYAAARQRLAAQDPESTQYIPYPQRWFNKGRYDESPEDWDRSSDRPSAPGKTRSSVAAKGREDN